MSVWTIAGEAGKAWDATAQVLEYRKVSGAQVSFRSLSVDVLSIRIDAENLTSYTPPDLGQRVDLYRSGTRFFSGTVTDIKASGNEALTVLVSGPWWWLERTNYVTNQTDGTGTAAARLTGVFGTTASGVNLKTAIETAINTAVTLGVPIANISRWIHGRHLLRHPEDHLEPIDLFGRSHRTDQDRPRHDGILRLCSDNSDLACHPSRGRHDAQPDPRDRPS